MKIITTIPVTHADISKKLTGGSKQGIVRMELGNRNLICREGKHFVEAEFQYIDADGNVLPNASNGIFIIAGDDLKAMSQLLNPSIPETDNIVDRFDAEVRAVAKYQMSLSFGITTGDIVDYVEPVE